MLAQLKDRVLAVRRARRVMRWIFSDALTSHRLRRKIFRDVQDYLDGLPLTAHGLACPETHRILFSMQDVFIKDWLCALHQHYVYRVGRCHVHPQVFDAVYGIIRRTIDGHKKGVAMACALEKWDDEIRQLAA